MRYRIGRWLQRIVFVTFAPGAAWGQPVARSLEELQALLTAAYASCNDNCDAPDPIPMFLFCRRIRGRDWRACRVSC